MNDRFIRHNIIGSEAHRPRPIAYLSSTGQPRRNRLRGGHAGWLVLVLVLTAAAALAVALG